MDGVELLEEIAVLLESKRLKYWVFGGYALDLAVGRVTRPHANIDLLIRLNDSAKVRDLLEVNGFITELFFDKVIARRDGEFVNLIMLDEFKGKYVISTVNVEVSVPKVLFDKPVKGELKGGSYPRIPNELVYLLNRYSVNPSDTLIANNLSVDSKVLKRIKVNVKRR